MRLSLVSTALAAALATAAPAAWAQVILDCDARASAANLVEPWPENTRSYAEGAIRLALLEDATAPACCRRRLLVLAPAGNGTTGRQCLVVAPDEERGFRDIDIGGVAASYSPQLGLELSVPVWLHREGTSADAPAFADRMLLLIDQARGTVSVE